MSKLHVFAIKCNFTTPTVIKDIKPAKKIIVPSLKDSRIGLSVVSAASAAAALSADTFIKNTNKKLDCVQQAYEITYERRGSDWFKIHIPCDGSGGRFEIPCRDPYERVYYPSS